MGSLKGLLKGIYKRFGGLKGIRGFKGSGVEGFWGLRGSGFKGLRVWGRLRVQWFRMEGSGCFGGLFGVRNGI